MKHQTYRLLKATFAVKHSCRLLQMKQTRKEVAELLRANKQENARIRVEAVIRDQNLLQAYEVLEVFLELLSVRLQLIEKSVDIPNDMLECLASLVYAASRIQVLLLLLGSDLRHVQFALLWSCGCKSSHLPAAGLPRAAEHQSHAGQQVQEGVH